MSLGPETVTYQGSGLVFNNTYGSGVSVTFRNEIVAAENYLQSQFGNSCTINCSFDLQSLDPAYSGENSFDPVIVSYSSFINALRQHAITPVTQTAAASLANLSDPSHGAGIEIAVGEAQILGLTGPSSGTNDTVIVILNGYYWTASALQNDPGDAEAVVEHELSEGVMGRIGSLGIYSPYWAPMDLFRYTASGQRDLTAGADGQATYFSLDGNIVYTGLQFHNSVNTTGRVDGYDLADWDGVGADSNDHDPFGPGGPGAGSSGTLSATDLMVLQALGWAPARNVIEANGSTELVQVGSNYFFYPVGGSSGPELQYPGVAVSRGPSGTWTPIGVERTASGYNVAWRLPGTNQYTVWNTDANGNFVSDIGVVNGCQNPYKRWRHALTRDAGTPCITPGDFWALQA